MTLKYFIGSENGSKLFCELDCRRKAAIFKNIRTSAIKVNFFYLPPFLQTMVVYYESRKYRNILITTVKVFKFYSLLVLAIHPTHVLDSKLQLTATFEDII